MPAKPCRAVCSTKQAGISAAGQPRYLLSLLLWACGPGGGVRTTDAFTTPQVLSTRGAVGCPPHTPTHRHTNTRISSWSTHPIITVQKQ
jgi:hypothetical protein